jgi:uncharacterized membrane protein
MARSTNPDRFFSEQERASIDAAIKQAEGRTSAEIKLVVARHCWTDLKTNAAALFRKLGLDKTAERNCVLILLILTNREFLIYGDQGIHEKVGQGFWDDVRDLMANHFRNDEFSQGLCEGVAMIGEKLARHFPRRPDDKNEISDEVVYEE